MTNLLSDKNAHSITHISISFLIWLTLYLVIYCRKTSTRIIKKSPNAIRLKRQELGAKLVSIFHAAYTSYGARQCLKEFNDLNLSTKSISAEHYVNVTAGFFIGDLMLCIILVEEHGIEFVIHAIASLGGSLYVSLTGIGQQYFLHILLFETSTPFLHIRSLLLEYGYGNTIIAQINNLIFLLTFGYFRLYKGIPIVATLCCDLLVQKHLSIVVIVFFIISGIAMTCLNIYWFTKILKNACEQVSFLKQKKLSNE